MLNRITRNAGSSDHMYAGALTRLRNFMLVLAPACTATAAWKFGSRPALGFLLGCTLAYLNFHWLESGIAHLADRVTNAGKPRSSKGIVTRFLLRYVLLAAAAYAILTSFPASLGGLFAGLFLPIGAIACETVYELYLSLTRRM